MQIEAAPIVVDPSGNLYVYIIVATGLQGRVLM